MALNAQILLSILAHESSSGDISQTLRATPATYSLSLADGTGANQAQVVWSDARTIDAGGVDDLDLTALSDDRGTIATDDIKAIYVRNTSASENIYLGAAASDPYEKPSSFWFFAPISSDGLGLGFPVRAGGSFFVSAPTEGGFNVSQSSRILRLSGASGATYEIILIGEGTIT